MWSKKQFLVHSPFTRALQEFDADRLKGCMTENRGVSDARACARQTVENLIEAKEVLDDKIINA